MVHSCNQPSALRLLNLRSSFRERIRRQALEYLGQEARGVREPRPDVHRGQGRQRNARYHRL